jgi:hypothetical protein
MQQSAVQIGKVFNMWFFKQRKSRVRPGSKKFDFVKWVKHLQEKSDPKLKLLTNQMLKRITLFLFPNEWYQVCVTKTDKGQSLYINGSLKRQFDGKGDYLVDDGTCRFTFDNKDFTIEFWVQLKSQSMKDWSPAAKMCFANHFRRYA